MRILRRDRSPLVRTCLLPSQQSCQPGSCSPSRWRRNTASEQSLQRRSLRWHQDGTQRNPRATGFTIHSLLDMSVRTSIIQMVPLTGFFFLISNKRIKNAQEFLSLGHCLSKSAVQYPLEFIYICATVPLLHVFLFRSHQKVSETENPQTPSSLGNREREAHLNTLLHQPEDESSGKNLRKASHHINSSLEPHRLYLRI